MPGAGGEGGAGACYEDWAEPAHLVADHLQLAGAKLTREAQVGGGVALGRVLFAPNDTEQHDVCTSLREPPGDPGFGAPAAGDGTDIDLQDRHGRSVVTEGSAAQQLKVDRDGGIVSSGNT